VFKMTVATMAAIILRSKDMASPSIALRSGELVLIDGDINDENLLIVDAVDTSFWEQWLPSNIPFRHTFGTFESQMKRYVSRFNRTGVKNVLMALSYHEVQLKRRYPEELFKD